MAHFAIILIFQQSKLTGIYATPMLYATPEIMHSCKLDVRLFLFVSLFDIYWEHTRRNSTIIIIHSIWKQIHQVQCQFSHFMNFDNQSNIFKYSCQIECLAHFTYYSLIFKFLQFPRRFIFLLSLNHHSCSICRLGASYTDLKWLHYDQEFYFHMQIMFICLLVCIQRHRTHSVVFKVSYDISVAHLDNLKEIRS